MCVMRLRKPIIVVLLIALFGLAVFALVTPRSVKPYALSVVSIVEGQDTKRVTVEILRLDATARFPEAYQLQTRVGSEWGPPLTLPRLTGGYLLARTNCQELVFELPRETEACRFSLGYRVGPRPYCEAYFFLSRHGVSKRFPALSKTILKCVPQQPRLRHFECELEIPAGSHKGAEANSKNRERVASTLETS